MIEPESVGGRLRFLFGKHSGAMAIEAVLNRHKEELSAAGVEVTPRLVQVLLRLVKGVREKKAMVSQHLDGVRNYYAHLERLGLTEEDLLAYAMVLGRSEKADQEGSPTAEHGGAAQRRRRARGVAGGEFTPTAVGSEFPPCLEKPCLDHTARYHPAA